MPGAVVEEIENQQKLEEHEDNPIIEDVKVEDDQVDDSDEEGGDLAHNSVMSRSEKKSRKAMLKLGMQAVIGVSCVTIKNTREPVMFSFSNPDVFKSPTSETYVIFGEAKMKDISRQTQASQRFRMPDMSSLLPKEEEEVKEEEEEEVDETGVDPKDVELVMTQAAVSRAKAVNALKASHGDIVGAIMEVTM